MRDLNYQLKMLCKHSHEGSFETRVGRERQLSAIANQLHDLGFRQMKATSLKQKHIQALVDHWLGQNLSPGTIKNRMSCLRWWACAVAAQQGDQLTTMHHQVDAVQDMGLAIEGMEP